MAHDPYRTFAHHAGMKNLHGCKKVGGVKKGMAPVYTSVISVRIMLISLQYLTLHSSKEKQEIKHPNHVALPEVCRRVKFSS